MSIASEIERIKSNIASAYTAASAKGATMPDVQNSANLSGCIDTITTGGGAPATKFGASVDTWIGDVDENGVLSAPTAETVLDFTGVKEIASSCMQYMFYERVNITSVILGSLQNVKSYGMYNAFYGTSITSVDLSLLQNVESYGLYYAFGDCEDIAIVVVCSLQKIGSSGLKGAFIGCKKIKIISYPSLTSVQSDSFGSSSTNNAYRNCTALTEIHFRADMQATIEAMSQYANKWGATNATIYFDLIGTITVNGVAYARNEPNSIRVDGTKTYVAWADESGNIVYTDATAEPAVDTPVYSDNGTTQVGTVSAVA